MSKKDSLSHNEYRFVVVGAGGVGKSAITVRFIQGNFVEKYDPTIEDSYIKQVEVDGVACVLDIMDTAGQEEYRALRDSYMKSGQGFVLVYSVISQTSFEHIGRLQKSIIRIKEETPDIPLMMVANKVDMEEERVVTQKQGVALATELECGYIESSAKTNYNISQIFQELVRRVNKWRDLHPPLAPTKKKKSTCALF
eukprot:CAMPEP_0174262284 /NCGR_PEP_ID=MMETSP0439-20130205/12887_1 /TAXON_ID=0 /ORGANISM="Stereomyxa ramosa, Strain Chinc5" /LENGTH=196 /DNA_ID=CAMNT_0015346975 /DNA_START=66 /DNA_END=656 /DNA_ORIENTATION=+